MSVNLARFVLFTTMVATLVACRHAESAPSAPVLAMETILPPAISTTPISPTATSTLVPEPSITIAVEAPVPTTTVAIGESQSPPCGVTLNALPQEPATQPSTLALDDATRAELVNLAPAAAQSALQRLMDSPDTVGLAAFQIGREAEGVYLNASVPMPLASVAKLITLVAYSEAIATGEINPLETVSLAELDRYYLPNFDLGAHRRAVAELRNNGQIISPDENPAVTLDNIAWMMIRHSSNAAADFLHARLGQIRIEETAQSLGLNDPPHSHSAPCTFLGQFLMMANHTRGANDDRTALTGFAEGGSAAAEAFGQEITWLFDTYVNQEEFRETERSWRPSTRRPVMTTQRYFAENLAPQGTAGAYASLMARLALNNLSNSDSSYQARRILEWPNQFDANREVFSNIGYKNGSLPGVLTTTYYAYRWGEPTAVVVVLFFRDLPQQTYRQWRNSLTHDELARWMLADPAAIPAMASAINGSIRP